MLQQQRLMEEENADSLSKYQVVYVKRKKSFTIITWTRPTATAETVDEGGNTTATDHYLFSYLFFFQNDVYPCGGVHMFVLTESGCSEVQLLPHQGLK